MQEYDPYRRLSQYVINRRTELGLSPAQLAERAGIDQGRISRIEAGRKIPTPETLAVLASALEVELEHLYRLAGYPVPELPALKPYLRRAYGVSDDAAEEVERYLQSLNAKYGQPGQPAPGEDEEPDN